MPEAVRVTPDNFRRAETDRHLADMAREAKLEKFVHYRQPTDIANQVVIRMNHDTLYSSAGWSQAAAVRPPRRRG